LFYTGKRTGKEGGRRAETKWSGQRWMVDEIKATVCLPKVLGEVAANHNAHIAPVGNAKTPLPIVNIDIIKPWTNSLIRRDTIFKGGP
jgi:hypothetical protein